MASTPRSPTLPSRADPAVVEVLRRAIAQHQSGQLVAAAQLYRQILEADPKHFDALHLLGVIRHQEGRYAEARDLIAAALEVGPRNADILSNFGLVLQELGRHEDAIEAWNQALAIDTRHAAALNNRGTALRELKRYPEALASYDRALAITPNYADALSNRGIVLQDLERFEEAVACFDGALRLDPAHALAWNNRGAALHALRRYDEAVASFDRAIAIRPAYANAFHNRGRALKELGRYDEAIANFRRAIALNPDQSGAYWDESLLHLLRGNFGAGWPGYEWRFRDKDVAMPPRDFPQPVWRGDQSISGRKILLHAEQGLGDTIQFIRYAPLVAARGADVTVEVQPALRTLMENLPGISKIVSKGDALPDFELHCPLLSLPLAFATTLDRIPAQVPYLLPRTDRIAKWRPQLPAADRLIGLVWSGNPRHKNDRNRSLPFSAIAPLLGAPGITFVSLQKDARPEDVEALRACSNMIDVAAGLQDFADTAAVIALLDLVVTADTSVAHLAGALGKPVWILLPQQVDWRWLLDREDSPWYPSARLFRQQRDGDWAEVVARVRRALDDPAGAIGRG